MLDHINRHTLKLGTVETLVLDEADEMLNMGFLEDIEKIISQVPERTSNLTIFSNNASCNQEHWRKIHENPEHVQIRRKEMTADLIDQYYVRSKRL